MPDYQSYIITPEGLLAHAKAAAPDPAGGIDHAFITATVPVWEPPAHRYLMGEKPIIEAIGRCTQWIGICATVKAQVCAAQRVRLYRRAQSSRLKGNGFRRVTDRARLKHLRSAASGKAAEYANETDDIEEVTEHLSLDVLRRPNPIMAGYAFAFSRFFDLESCGNCFSHHVYRNGKPAQVYRLAPHKTAVLPSRTDFIEGYRYGWMQQDKVIFPTEEVDHFHYMPSPFTPYLGMSWVQWVILDADRFAASTQNDLSLWMRSARPDAAVKMPPNTTPSQMKQLQEEVNRRFRGPDKAFGLWMTTAEEISPIQWSPKDLEGVASRSDAKQLIQAAAGVPEAIFAMNDANRASAMMALAQFAKLSIQPRLCQDQDELTHKFMPRFGLVPGPYWFAYDNPVPDDIAAEVTRHDTSIKNGSMTLNESRAEQGLEAYPPEIGDVPMFNGVPIGSEPDASETGGEQGADGRDGDGQDGAVPGVGPEGVAADVQATALNGTQVQALQALLAAVTTGELPKESARAAINAAFPTLTPEQIGAMIDPLEQGSQEPADGVDATGNGGSAGELPAADAAEGGGRKPGKGHRGWHPKSVYPAYLAGHAHGEHIHKDDRKDPLSSSQKELTSEIEATCRRWYEGIAKGVKDGDSIAEAMHGQQQELEKLLAPLLRRVLTNAAVAEVGEEAFTTPPASALHYLENYTPKLAKEITESTAEMMRNALKTGLEDGLSVAQMQDRIAESLGQESDYRAERIARTEVSNIGGMGRLQGAKAAGLLSKEWHLRGQACPECLAIKAEHPGPIPIDAPFFEGNPWQNGQTNPAHPNCYCNVTYSVNPVEGE